MRALLPLLLFPLSSAPDEPLRVLTRARGPRVRDPPLLRPGRGQELEVRWVEPFEDVLPRLARGAGDVAAATLTLTEERKKRFDCSSSYFPVRTMLLEPEGQSAPSLEALAGETLVTIPGSIYEQILSAVPRAKILRVTTDEEYYGFPLPKGSPLTSALSKHIAMLKSSGIYFRLLGRDFGPEAVEVVRSGRTP